MLRKPDRTVAGLVLPDQIGAAGTQFLADTPYTLKDLNNQLFGQVP